MSDSVRPHRQEPTRLPRPWDSPGKNTEVGCHFLLQCMKVKSESEVAQSCRPSTTPWTAAFQAPPSVGFPRQEYWSGVPLSRHLSLLTRRMSKFKNKSQIENDCNTSSNKMAKVDLNMQQWLWKKRKLITKIQRKYF